MNFQSLPTDNLYKFIALSGLAIILVCGYTIVEKMSEIEKVLVDTELKVEELKLKSKVYKERANAIQSILDSGIGHDLSIEVREIIKKFGKESVESLKIVREKMYSMVNYGDSEFKNIIESIAFIDNILEFENKKLEVDKISLEIILSTKKMEILNKKFLSLGIKGSLIMGIGVGISFFGFYCWYSHKQKYEDLILKKEYEK